jgi:SAM-dependent methyltransferase
LQASAEPGNTFGRVAEQYARTRPPYPRAAIERAIAELGLDADATVLDLGAGTGNLTRALRDHFTEVIAVEPDPDMRAQFDGEVLAGSAEAIPLAEDVVDAVFAGEAFHWFDVERAIVEIERVTRPGGGLATLARMWGEYEQPGLVPPSFKADMDAVWARFHDPDRTFPDWRTPAGLVGHEEFVDYVRISGRDLVDLHLTGSTLASIDDEERAAIGVRAYPLMDDEYQLRVVTYLSWRRFD